MITIVLAVAIILVAVAIVILAGILSIPVFFAFIDFCAGVLVFEGIAYIVKSMLKKKKDKS